MAEFNEIRTPDMDEPFEGDGRPPGFRAALLAMAGGVLALAVPYVAAEVAGPETKLAELRVWTPEDSPPFANHFKTSGVGAQPVPAGATASAGSIVDDGAEPPAPAIVTPVITLAPPEPAPATPEASKPGEPAAPPAPTSPYARIAIPPAAFEGLTVAIEDPSGALEPFWRRLADVALKTPGAKVRLAQWGDSAIAADGMPSATRRLLQRTFGDGGHGFSLIAASNPWYRRKDVEWASSGWTADEFIRDSADDRRYGYGGVVASGGPGAKASWKTVVAEDGAPAPEVGLTASSFQVFYQATKRGHTFDVLVDGAVAKTVEASADPAEDRAVSVEVPDGPHTFGVKVTAGRARLYGVAVERADGVVYDGLGVVGARDTRWLNADEAAHLQALRQRKPDLYILMYGGNALEDQTSMDWYREHLTQVVARWRKALPEQSCLIMTPIDHGERHRGRVRTVPRQVELMAVQREVAKAEGCAFFSLYDAMGGDGAIGRWFETGLASGDLAHPTAKGSVELGRLFYMALMQGLHGWVEAQKKLPPPAPTPAPTTPPPTAPTTPTPAPATPPAAPANATPAPTPAPPSGATP
jgi:hypothetical protein